MKIQLFAIAIITISIFANCNNKEETNSNKDNKDNEPSRTVMVYMAAENNLSFYVDSDISEMVNVSSSLRANARLVVFVDKKGSTPILLEIKDGKKDTIVVYNEDFYSSDPTMMSQILGEMISKYPAESYGLVLWGHASGWFIESLSTDEETSEGKPRKAYGIDYGTDNSNNEGKKWINISTLAKVLEGLPAKLEFIFADCCNFQCVEVAYELRNCAKYIIGSPAEIPDVGAPYDKILPHLFSTATDFYQGVAYEYNAMELNDEHGEECHLPVSVIKTDALEDLARATQPMFSTLAKKENLDLDTVIYYRGDELQTKVMIDMLDIMMLNIGESEEMNAWREAFDNVVTYKIASQKWITADFVSFKLFNISEERYGGISVFIPQDIFNTCDPYNYHYNDAIKKTSWYEAARVNVFFE